MTLEKKATIISSLTAGFLTIIKLIIGVMSGSVALIASAVDSILDMFVSLFNLFAVHNSEKPADDKFNYGRGKIEALAAVIEGSVIAFSGLFILYEATKRYFSDEPIKYLDLSIIVMVISIVVTLLLVIFLNYVAKKTNSLVIKSDALHYKTDLFANGAVIVSLVLVFFTNIQLIDTIVGAMIALYIIHSAYELIKEGVLVLLDEAMEDDIVAQIEDAIKTEDKAHTYHYLKTRQAGKYRFVDVHVVFHCLISLLEAHQASDRIEDKIKKIDENCIWIINIHLDPYDDSVQNAKCIDNQVKKVK
jgi:cation diffusion facilitator family transporter